MSPFLPGGVRAYPALILVGVVTGVLAFARCARVTGVPPGRAVGFALAMAAAGLLGGRVYEIVVEGNPWHLASWANLVSPGFRYPGVVIAMVASVPVLGRWLFPGVSLAALADAGIPAFGLGLGIARIGCFLEGCCFGVPSNLPWAVSFPASTPVGAYQMIHLGLPPEATRCFPVHPLQLYFVLLAFAAGAVALRLRGRAAFDGQVFLVFLALHEGGKGLLEFLRAPDPFNGGPHLQIVSFALAALATVTLVGCHAARSRVPGAARRAAAAR